MDGAVFEPRLADEVLAIDRVERPLLVPGDAERHHVAGDGALPLLGCALADVSDPLANQRRLGRQLASRHAGRAPARRQQRGEHAQRRRLARAVWPKESEYLAAAHFEVDPGERLDLTLARPEDAAQTMRF